jgi:hypothetical protein
MKTLLGAVVALLLLGSTAYGRWYVGPTVVYPSYAAAPVYAYPAPVVVSGPQVVYAPYVAGPVVVPAPVFVGRPVVVGPTGKVYIVGRPVRNVVRAVLP